VGEHSPNPVKSLFPHPPLFSLLSQSGPPIEKKVIETKKQEKFPQSCQIPFPPPPLLSLLSQSGLPKEKSHRNQTARKISPFYHIPFKPPCLKVFLPITFSHTFFEPTVNEFANFECKFVKNRAFFHEFRKSKNSTFSSTV
jgi:hypothetical protein